MKELSYKFIPDDKVIRKCSVCGREITKGYVWDGTDTFCTKKCAAKALGNDNGCVNILIDDGRIEWHENFDNMQTFSIQTPHDVAKFFIWLTFDRHIQFHPDDSFAKCENFKTHEPTFSPMVANYLDKVMQRSFEVCEKYNRDIYEIAIRICELYAYCD